MNNQPIVDTKVGKIEFLSHKYFGLIDDENFSSLIYFFEPINSSLNYLEKNFDYLEYNAVGISGGGWTVTLYSAIDERISNTFSIAGGVPFFMRSLDKNFGDYEQTLPDLYRTVNYLELYIMGSYGEGRSQLQIFNKYDPCCFSGNNYVYYEEIIKNKIAELNHGKFSIFSDDTHREHQISENSLKQILEELKS